jgi:hypothetical protein
MDDERPSSRPPARFLSREDLVKLYAQAVANEPDPRLRTLAQTRLETLQKVMVDSVREDFILRATES